MNFEPDFRTPNSNETVIAAAVVAFVIVGVVWAMTEVFGGTSTTHAATATARTTMTAQSCSQWLHERQPAVCDPRELGGEEDADATH